MKKSVADMSPTRRLPLSFRRSNPAFLLLGHPYTRIEVHDSKLVKGLLIVDRFPQLLMSVPSLSAADVGE